jgi:hypothetical protein
MYQTKVIVSLASLCSAMAIFIVVLTISELYATINDIHAQVIDGVGVFRVIRRLNFVTIIVLHTF